MIDEHILDNIIEKHGIRTEKRLRPLVWKRAAVVNFLKSQKYGWSDMARILNRDHATMIYMGKYYKEQSAYDDFREFVAPIEQELNCCLMENKEVPTSMNIQYLSSQVKLMREMADRLTNYIEKHGQDVVQNSL